MTVAESLRRFRQEYGIKQKDVAEALGISQQAYQPYEVKVKPSAEVIAKIAVAFNVSADYLLGITDKPRSLNGENFENEIIELTTAYNDALQKALERRKLAIKNSQPTIK